jgi:hypothetical protein
MPRKRIKPKVVIFTGVQNIQMAQFSYINDVLDSLRASVFISGGAAGIDTYCCVEAWRRFASSRHIVCVPWRYARNDVHIAWCVQNDLEVLDLPRPPRSKKPEIARNEYMIKLGVDLASELNTDPILVAFPGGPQEVLRSGTWTTIRRAKAAEVRSLIHPLSEAEGQLHGGGIEI